MIQNFSNYLKPFGVSEIKKIGFGARGHVQNPKTNEGLSGFLKVKSKSY